MTEILNNILLALNNIDVRGKENMNNLLGSILMIEDLILQLSAPQKEENEDG